MDTGDESEKDPSLEDMQDRHAAFQILSPSGYVPDRRFIASGTGARPNSQPVRIYEYGADTLLGSNFTITVPVPVPSLSVMVGADRKPVFSGFGHSWPDQPAAQIEVRRVGESTPAAPIVDVRNDRWSTTATEAWNPGTYCVEAGNCSRASRPRSPNRKTSSSGPHCPPRSDARTALGEGAVGNSPRFEMAQKQ